MNTRKIIELFHAAMTAKYKTDYEQILDNPNQGYLQSKMEINLNAQGVPSFPAPYNTDSSSLYVSLMDRDDWFDKSGESGVLFEWFVPSDIHKAGFLPQASRMIEKKLEQLTIDYGKDTIAVMFSPTATDEAIAQKIISETQRYIAKKLPQFKKIIEGGIAFFDKAGLGNSPTEIDSSLNSGSPEIRSIVKKVKTQRAGIMNGRSKSASEELNEIVESAKSMRRRARKSQLPLARINASPSNVPNSIRVEEAVIQLIAEVRENEESGGELRAEMPVEVISVGRRAGETDYSEGLNGRGTISMELVERPNYESDQWVLKYTSESGKVSTAKTGEHNGDDVVARALSSQIEVGSLHSRENMERATSRSYSRKTAFKADNSRLVSAIENLKSALQERVDVADYAEAFETALLQYERANGEDETFEELAGMVRALRLEDDPNDYDSVASECKRLLRIL